MSEVKHTPGPWRLDDAIHGGVLNTDYHAIDAGCGFYPEGGGHREPGFGVMGFMSPADARLIAAAPKLLKALQWIVSDLEFRADLKRGEEKGVVDIGNTGYVMAREAIAEATGEQQ